MRVKRSWKCPHSPKFGTFVLRGRKEDYSSPNYLYARLCKECFEVYSKSSMFVGKAVAPAK